jgi:tetratricopeptide (TPR) repeat protein
MFTIAVLVAVSASKAGFAQQQQVNTKEQIEAKSAYIDGVAAFENEDFQRALDLLNTAYVKLPDHPGVNFALADAYLQINDIGNAEYYGKQAIKLDPKNRWYRLKLVDIYQLSGKTEAAINELNKALEYHPGDQDLLQELAQLYSNHDAPRQANKIYNKLLYLRGEDINLRLQKLQNFNSLNMQDSAIVELQKIRELDPGNLSTLQLLSNYYLEMNRLEEARKVLQNALQINRTDPKSLIMLSDVYMSEAKWDSVGTTLGNVVADSTVSSQTKLKVCRYLYSKFKENEDKAGIRDAASTVFQNVMTAEQESAKILTLAADFFTETKQNELALQALERTTNKMPTNDSAWQQRLQLLMREGKIKEVITVGQQAAEQIPQDPIILYFLGSAYLSDQNHQKAIEHLQEASTLPARKPLKASIYGSLGDAYAAIEAWAQSFENYEKSLSINPENAVILNNYAYYLSLQQRKLSKAEEMVQHALDIDPGNTSYLDTLGWIYYQKEEFQKAREYIQAAIDTGQASAEVLEHMGDVMNKLEELQEAKTWWQKALDKDSTRTYLKDKIAK